VIELGGMIFATNEGPDFGDTCQVSGVETADRTATDDAKLSSSLLRSSFSKLHQLSQLSAFAMLERAEDAVAIIKRVVDKDALRKQRVLQGRRNCVDRSRAPPRPCPFAPAVAVGRRCSRVPVLNVRNIHRGDRSVIAEGAGHHISDGVIDTGFHQSRTDTMRGGAIDLSFNDRRIDDCAAIIDGHVVKNLRNKSIGGRLRRPRCAAARRKSV